jgi:hypothetical protein
MLREVGMFGLGNARRKLPTSAAHKGIPLRKALKFPRRIAEAQRRRWRDYRERRLGTSLAEAS